MNVKHREFVDSIDVTRPDGIYYLLPKSEAIPGWDLNPASDSLFPWLCNIASSWEKYRFRSVRFLFNPRQPTTSRGRLLTYFEYDYADPAAASKADFLNTYGATEVSAFLPCSVVVNCKCMNDSTPWRWTDPIVKGSGVTRDATLVNGGYLVVAVDGLTASEAYSWDLWVEYDVDFEVQKPAEEGVQSMEYVAAQQEFGVGMVLDDSYVTLTGTWDRADSDPFVQSPFYHAITMALITLTYPWAGFLKDGKPLAEGGKELPRSTISNFPILAVPRGAGPGVLEVWWTTTLTSEGYYSAGLLSYANATSEGDIFSTTLCTVDCPPILGSFGEIMLREDGYTPTRFHNGLLCIGDYSSGSGTALGFIAADAHLTEYDDQVGNIFVKRDVMMFNGLFQKLPPGTQGLTPCWCRGTESIAPCGGTVTGRWVPHSTIPAVRRNVYSPSPDKARTVEVSKPPTGTLKKSPGFREGLHDAQALQSPVRPPEGFTFVDSMDGKGVLARAAPPSTTGSSVPISADTARRLRV